MNTDQLNETALINWVNNVLSSLPVCQEEFFKELWEKRRLSYIDSPNLIDAIDENNAKIICTALDQRQSCFFVLPDDKPHRGALMFGTALVRFAVQCIIERAENQTVLYFGTSVGFKYSLSKTSVGKTILDSVFSYTHAAGKYDKFKNYKRSDTLAANLPEVICIYHPDNPQEFVQKYKPDWICFDCGKDIEVPWLEDLVSYCRKKGIPILAWGQNGFSNVIELFERFDCRIFYSPKGLKNNLEKNFGKLFFNKEQRVVEPIIFVKSNIEKIDGLLCQSRKILQELNAKTSGQVKKDALRTGWILLKTIEQLSIPVGIFNAEARSFRFVYSFDSLNQTLNRYIEIISKNDGIFSSRLDEFKNRTDGILDAFSISHPPYWSALSDYCLDRPPEGTLRIIVFPKRHQKQIFSYTLLSKFDIKEDELINDSHIILRTLKEFTNPVASDREIFNQYVDLLPIVAGLPDYSNRHLFYQVINDWNTKVLIYPHQLCILKTILNDFNRRDVIRIEKSIVTIKELTKNKKSNIIPRLTERYILSDKIIELHIENNKVTRIENLVQESLLEIGDIYTELSRLFENSEQSEEDIEYLVSINVASEKEDINGNTSGLLVEQVREISLQDNYRLIVDPHDQISVLRDGKIDKIYARGIRQGDRIVLIENQSRHSLYDLIIARVHNHPSLEIHLGLLKKWKEDFYCGYSIWKQDRRNNVLGEFLKILQTKGSRITTALTINNWVNGYVMRPQDEEDLRRIGEILDLSFLKENYHKVNAAASRIIGIHISLSRKLNEWLENRAKNFQHDDMELIDEELGLTFGELRSSIKVLKVIEVRDKCEPTLRNHLGRLEKNN